MITSKVTKCSRKKYHSKLNLIKIFVIHNVWQMRLHLIFVSLFILHELTQRKEYQKEKVQRYFIGNLIHLPKKRDKMKKNTLTEVCEAIQTAFCDIANRLIDSFGRCRECKINHYTYVFYLHACTYILIY